MDNHWGKARRWPESSVIQGIGAGGGVDNCFGVNVKKYIC